MSCLQSKECMATSLLRNARMEVTIRFYYYGCKHRNMTRGHKCDYKKQVHEEMLDASVAEVISKLVSNPKFSDLIRNKINMEVDTSALGSGNRKL